MRMAIIENDVVINVIETGEGYVAPDGAIMRQTDVAGPGWTYIGGAFAPPPPPPACVPTTIALWQARAILGAQGLLADANAAVAASGDPLLTAVWEYGNTISRASPGLAALAAALGLADADVDALFISADALTA